MTKNNQTTKEPGSVSGTASKLQGSIESLEERIEQENKTSRIFFLGIVGGLGRAVGATVIFSVVAILLSTLLYQTGWFPEFNDYISRFTPGERGSVE